jgi:hypothetical protein
MRNVHNISVRKLKATIKFGSGDIRLEDIKMQREKSGDFKHGNEDKASFKDGGILN